MLGYWLKVGSDRALPPNATLPPNPIRPYGFGLQLDLVFSAAGVLDLDASTVQAGEIYDGG